MNIETQKSLRSIEKIIGGTPTLGDFLKSWRKCENMSQKNFAELLGISKQYLCDIEKGRKIPHLKTIAVIAKKIDYFADLLIQLTLQHEVEKEGLRLKVAVSYA